MIVHRDDPDRKGVSRTPMPDAEQPKRSSGKASRDVTACCPGKNHEPPALAAALCYLAEGFWPVPIREAGEVVRKKTCKGKEPIGLAWGLERQTEHGLREHFRGRPGRGVGLCLGPGRGDGDTWLIDLECDGPEGAASLDKLLAEAIPTRGWTSARGGHLLFIVNGPRLLELLAAAGAVEADDTPGAWHLEAFPDLEWRVGGFKPDGQAKQLQSVCPPSPGSDGMPRRWTGGGWVAPLPESVYGALEALGERQAIQQEPAKVNGETLDAIIAAFGDKTTGERHAFMLKATMWLAARVKAGELTEQEALDGLKDGARQNGMLDEGRWPEVLEAWRTAKQLAKPAAARRTAGDERIDYGKLSNAELGIIPAESVAERPIDWLWRYRLAIGEMALLAGDGGLGKSSLLLAIAARITTGDEWPDKSGRAALGSVVIVSAEDSRETTLKPRLMALGADLKRVVFVTARMTIQRQNEPPLVHPMSLRSLDYWRQVLGRVPDCKLVIIDPVPSYLGRGVNDAKNSELREVVEPFIETVIRPAGACFVANTHLNKCPDHKSPIHRITGNTAYGNLPRNVHFVVRDPDKPERRLFKQAKCNNAPDDLPAIAYSLVRTDIDSPAGPIETAIPVFEASTAQIDLTEAMNAARGRRGPAPEKTGRVALWLLGYLRQESRPTRLRDIFDAAGAAGHVGEQRLDKQGRLRWSNVAILYRARDMIPNLPAPDDGWIVDEIKDDSMTHWHASKPDGHPSPPY
jgi:hypothetical protein